MSVSTSPETARRPLPPLDDELATEELEQVSGGGTLQSNCTCVANP